MRAGVIILLILALFATQTQAAPYEWGCCLPAAGSCVPGNSSYFADKDAFTEFCGQIEGARIETSFNTCVGQCEIGCCCAGANVDGREVINNTEADLRLDRWACTKKTTSSLTYQYISLATKPAGTSCVQACGGGVAGPGTGTTPTTKTVQGTVKNSTGSMRNVGVTFYTGGLAPITATSDANGRYSVTVPANKRYVVSAVPSIAQCKPTSFELLVDTNKNQDITLECTATGGCISNKPSVTSLALVPGTDDVTFSITFDDRCGNFNSFVPFRCTGTGNTQACTALPVPTGRTVTDSGLTPDTNYCYKVRAYNTLGFVDSDCANIRTGDAECMAGERTLSWCGNDEGRQAVYSCNNRNILTQVSCTETQACSVSGSGASCIPKTDCDRCNGLLGLFAKVGIQIPGGSNRLLRCGTETPQCYIDKEKNQPLLTSAYSFCSDVENCDDYRSRTACEGGNACKIGDGSRTACRWKPASEELGTGVCVSTDPNAVPPCRRCEELLGFCNREMCQSISTGCYYDDVTSGAASNGFEPQGCMPKQEMACRFYDNETHCIGPAGNRQAANFAITYSDQQKNTRAGTTNERTASKDLFGIGACTWIAASDRCIKDADNRRIADEDDCVEDGLQGEALALCFSDVSPPTTDLVLKDPPEYGSSEVTSLPVAVSDDKTPINRITTYACLNLSGPCYPNKPFAELALPDVNADYTVYYYSIDMHHNSEVVKSDRIRVKKDNIPRLNTVDIDEEG